ncbi:MAG: DUF4214 domain-containing protein [Solobacterium sp.]|nr:DUF4214 domain-containing protein [Solobacterium sp.]
MQHKMKRIMNVLLTLCLSLTFFITPIKAQGNTTSFLTNLYQQCLNRNPSSNELMYWQNQLETRKQSASEVVYHFFNSKEFTKANPSALGLISKAYIAILSREGSSAEKNYWLNQFRQGKTKDNLLVAFTESKEFTKLCESYQLYKGKIKTDTDAERFVKRLYQLCLLRKADTTGLRYWADSLTKKSKTAASVVYGFFYSQEFLNRNLSDASFIQTAYQTILNRRAAQNEIDYWQSILDQGFSRLYLLKGFVQSKEFAQLASLYQIQQGSLELKDVCDKNEAITRFVSRFYQKGLGRNASHIEIHSYVAPLVSKSLNAIEFAKGVLLSSEMQREVNNQQEFVRRAFRTMLNREPSNNDVISFSALSKQQIVDSIAKSQEYKNLATSIRLVYPTPTVSPTPQKTTNIVTNPAKTIYLTFDDGPGPYTDSLLATLAKYNVKATFFVTSAYPAYAYCLRKAHEQGHTVAVHTATHQYSTIYQSSANYWADFNRQNQIIYEQTGSYTNLFRFPGGSSNTVSRNYNRGIMTRLANEARQKGYLYFDWNVSSGDAGETTNTNVVYQNVIYGIQANTNKGLSSVVLQHDTKAFSVQAVENIIRWGLAQGYTFLAIDSSSPTVHHSIAN